MMRQACTRFICLLVAGEAMAGSLEDQFLNLPMSAKRHTGPLFWLHGDESPERLNEELNKVAEGGNGTFTAESRPHKDWLGEGWYRDLGVCLDSAKRLDLKMWIFDEDWWPSQTVAGKVPDAYAAKKMVAKAAQIQPGGSYQGNPGRETNFIALVAGRLDAAGAVEAASLRDLTPLARKGAVHWNAPADGRVWQVMTFSWTLAPRLQQGNRAAVDGMSPACVDWYIQTVYEPHYARFGKAFGKTIQGYFFDEPETPGDWGAALNETLKARGVDWMPAYVAWEFKLAGEAQSAAFYQYAEARADTWGRVMYGGLSAWCRKHGVQSIGHFMEHGGLYVHPEFCAGDMMHLQKYCSMGGIDAVFTQFAIGQRDTKFDPPCWQTPKLGSSVSHVYGKPDDVAMCEIFGARGQDVTYPEMKWWADHMQVSGINFLIPHSFNPRAPRDTDCPPYFYNGGYEPRYALYRVWADYTSRLSLMLTGGRHVCPVAVLFSGNARRTGAYTTPEALTTALQDALYDSDWLPFERFEDSAAKIKNGELRLHGESYRALVVPPTEGIPFATLEKVRAFYEAGGVVIGYGRLPTQSLTPGKTASEVAALRETLWGAAAQSGLAVCRTSAKGGRTYFLPETPTPSDLAGVLSGAKVAPPVRLMAGQTDGWIHALRRVDREGRDVLLVVNQNTNRVARALSLSVSGVAGAPEVWDAMRGEITAVPWRDEGNSVSFELTLEPLESALVRFGGKADRPVRLGAESHPLASFTVAPDPTAASIAYPVPDKGQKSPCAGTAFQGVVDIPKGVLTSGQSAYLVCEMSDGVAEEAAAVRVNGAYAGGFIGKPYRVHVSRALKPGRNAIRIEPFPVSRVRIEIFDRTEKP